MTEDGITRDEFDAYREAVRQRLDALEQRIDDLESVVVPGPEEKPFAEFDFDERVRYLRDHLVRQAERNDGEAAIDYRGVYELFHREYSTAHCYQIMEAAAEAEHFRYGELGQSENQRLAIDAPVNAVAGDLHVKNA